MQTTLLQRYRDTPLGMEAEAIVRSCVHCGFCTATCPTYQLLGDELDSPRGRIYLMKQMLEGHPVTAKTQLHLDRCLTCRACETTCPSGVEYGRLIDIGRHVIEQQVPRPLHIRLLRRALRAVLPYPRRFKPLLRGAQALRPWLPRTLQAKVPSRAPRRPWPTTARARRMLVLAGCVQSAATPHTNTATARVLDRLGIQLLHAPAAGCCGALSHHLSASEEALTFMRRNIDAWWPYLQDGVEAIITTASGCGVVVKDYGKLLARDAEYAHKAARVSALTRDAAEIIALENLTVLGKLGHGKKVAFQAPCTLQHGQRITGLIERVLTQTGYTLTAVPDAHLCCGSAGTYSLLQPQLAAALRADKLTALTREAPDIIATANIGCQLHLGATAPIPVKHWIELLDA